MSYLTIDNIKMLSDSDSLPLAQFDIISEIKTVLENLTVKIGEDTISLYKTVICGLVLPSQLSPEHYPVASIWIPTGGGFAGQFDQFPTKISQTVPIFTYLFVKDYTPGEEETHNLGNQIEFTTKLLFYYQKRVVNAIIKRFNRWKDELLNVKANSFDFIDVLKQYGYKDIDLKPPVWGSVIELEVNRLSANL